MNRAHRHFVFFYVRISIILSLCFNIQSLAQEDDKSKIKELKEGISQFVTMAQHELTCLVKSVSISFDNRNRDLDVIILVKVKRDIIILAADELRALGGKIPDEPKILPEKSNKVIALDRLIGGVFGFICTRSKALKIKVNTQTIILLDIKATPINSISANRQNIYDAGLSNDFKRLFSIMTIKNY